LVRATPQELEEIDRVAGGLSPHLSRPASQTPRACRISLDGPVRRG
jgi:hypothetical protein